MKKSRFLFRNTFEYLIAFLLLYYALPYISNSYQAYKIKNETSCQIKSFIKKYGSSRVVAYNHYYGSEKTLYVPRNINRQKIVNDALHFLGKPYIWGGEDSLGVDCSGLVYNVFRKNGINIPRTASQQYKYGKLVNIKQLKQGDLLFFETYKPGPSHVGIYLGKGRYIQALNKNTGVIISRINSEYSRKKFIGAKDILGS